MMEANDRERASRPTVNPAGEHESVKPSTPGAIREHTRDLLRGAALRNAMQKRANGVPTYTVPEAAALLSISQEYLYRLIQADTFPAVRMRIGGKQGRYVVPAQAVEQLLNHAADVGACVEASAWTQQWQAEAVGGVA